MSMTKKHRVDGTEVDAEVKQPTVQDSWKMMKAGGPKLYSSLKEYVNDDDATKGDPCELMASVYYKNAELENQYVCPAAFLSFDVTRGDRNEITRISDSEKGSLSGKQLSRVLAYAAMDHKGMGKVIMVVHPDDRIEVLAVPSSIQLIDGSKSKAAKDNETARSLLTHKSVSTVYTSPEAQMELLKLDYVDLSEVTNLLKALNTLSGKEDVSATYLKSLTNVESIQQRLTEESIKISKKNFLQTMFACRIASMENKEKVRFFSENPSYTLANQLELRLPHSGPCYQKLGNKKATQVRIGDLGDDTEVLLSTHVMSSRDYQDVRGDTLNYQVYADTGELGGRRKNKFSEMKVKFTMSAALVRKILATLSNDNEPVKKTSEKNTASSAKAEDFNDVELD